MDREACQFIWEQARTYLVNNGLSEDQIEKHLNLYKSAAPSSLNDVYRRLINSLVNKQGFDNYIGDLSALDPFLKNYSPTQVMIDYPDWEHLIDTLKASDFRPPSVIDKDDTRNSWVHFTKGVVSGARYLVRFQDHLKFDEFVKGYTINGKHIQLVNEIAREIHGYGFALTCDFLKELGYSDFVKPDTHINDIFYGLGLSQSKEAKNVFNSVQDFAKSVGEIPYRVDKMFWLIGSGKPYLISKERIPTNKFNFIKNTKSLLEAHGYEVKEIISGEFPKEQVIEKEKIQYRELNDLLIKLRKDNKISPKEYRNYAKRWLDNPEARVELLEDLSNMKLK